MTKRDVQKLNHGLYKIFWKESHGGFMSLASVGSDQFGNRWMAPCNHASGSTTECWYAVEKVELILSNRENT